MTVNAFRLAADRRDHKEILKELVTHKKDLVHPLSGIQNWTGHYRQDLSSFSEMRVGDSDVDKHVWVTLKDQNNRNVGLYDTDRHHISVNASLYTHLQTKVIRDERDLHGSADKILNARPATLKSNPTAVIFYSVNRFEDSIKGAGTDIIDSVANAYQDMYPNIWLSTLSPLRGFSNWVEKDFLLSSLKPLTNTIGFNVDGLKGAALAYLCSQENGVQKFHMGRNGAYIGDIKVNANTSYSEDARQGLNVMVNYVYPDRAQRDFNRKVYADGQINMAPHLHEYMKDVSSMGYAQIPSMAPTHVWTAKPTMF